MNSAQQPMTSERLVAFGCMLDAWADAEIQSLKGDRAPSETVAEIKSVAQTLNHAAHMPPEERVRYLRGAVTESKRAAIRQVVQRVESAKAASSRVRTKNVRALYGMLRFLTVA